jgi:hypothetical protein
MAVHRRSRRDGSGRLSLCLAKGLSTRNPSSWQMAAVAPQAAVALTSRHNVCFATRAARYLAIVHCCRRDRAFFSQRVLGCVVQWRLRVLGVNGVSTAGERDLEWGGMGARTMALPCRRPTPRGRYGRDRDGWVVDGMRPQGKSRQERRQAPSRRVDDEAVNARRRATRTRDLTYPLPGARPVDGGKESSSHFALGAANFFFR